MPRTEDTHSQERALYSPEYYSSLIAGLVHKLNNVTTVLSGHSGLILMDSNLPREIRDPVVRRKRKARYALSTKPVPDPLPGGALVGKVPGHDQKWSSASW